MKIVNGEYIYFIDSDDFIDKDAIEYLYNLCKKYDVKFSTCLSQRIKNYNFKIKKNKEKVFVINSQEMLKKILLGKNDSVTTWNKLIKRELYNNIRFENKFVNDNDVTHKLVINAKKIAYSNQIKYFYFQNPNGITANSLKNTERTINLYKVVVSRYKYIKNYYPNFIENDIGFLRKIIKLYLIDDVKVQEFLEEQQASKYIKELFSYKMLFYKISLKTKLLFILFKINPRFCKRINNKYQVLRYSYKM